MTKRNQKLIQLSEEITACNRCLRLRKYCITVARKKRRAFLTDDYWGRPVPGFGDPAAQLILIGLAPAAHGANRTGRMFTGDRSGEWLYRALHKAGFASKATSTHRQDGLRLKNAYVTAAVRCAPPQNKPTPQELMTCSIFLKRELELLDRRRLFIALGRIALNAIWKEIGEEKSRPTFAHGAHVKLSGDRHLLMSFHPSQQNTFTGRLTEPMFDSVFRKARKILSN